MMSASVTLPLLRRLTAFTSDPSGGNPAGVWIGNRLPGAAEMQRIAAEVGYSETAFLAPVGDRRYTTRYYSPRAEVTFCGHATIASGVLLGELEGMGRFVLSTLAGDVVVEATRRAGALVASLTSVDTSHVPVPDVLLTEALAAFGWSTDVLDRSIPPAVAYAGAHHLVLALRDHATLDAMRYDFDRLGSAMLANDLTTVQLVWRRSVDLFHARDPFPVGGVVEDPATGAAAAAFGGYLRDSGLLAAPATFVILQGEAMGRPSRIEVSVPESGGITVSGEAVSIET
jgi:PhzF family phenazine biosynthesis protein